MPELPEVETVRRQLIPAIKEKTITSVEVFHNKTVAFDESFEDRLLGQTIATIDRIGKLLIVSFSTDPELYMLTHLKMTGQFFYTSEHNVTAGGGHSVQRQDIETLPNRHTRVAFSFADGGTLYFNDMRLFGYVRLANRAQMMAARDAFGPEPISSSFPTDDFVRVIRTRQTSVKAALLNQAFIAGLGNIYVDEALFSAKVRPTRVCARLSKREAVAIAHHAGRVMRESIDVGGTTFQHFVDTNGASGNFTNQLQVFGKQGTPCPVCGTIIKKIRVAGRGTHYCPSCQK